MTTQPVPKRRRISRRSRSPPRRLRMSLELIRLKFFQLIPPILGFALRMEFGIRPNVGEQFSCLPLFIDSDIAELIHAVRQNSFPTLLKRIRILLVGSEKQGVCFRHERLQRHVPRVVFDKTISSGFRNLLREIVKDEKGSDMGEKLNGIRMIPFSRVVDLLLTKIRTGTRLMFASWNAKPRSVSQRRHEEKRLIEEGFRKFVAVNCTIRDKSFSFPVELIMIILSFMKHDYQLVCTVGLVCEEFLYCVLGSWRKIRCFPSTLRKISLVVLRNVQVVAFRIRRKAYVPAGWEYVSSNLTLPRLKVLDFSSVGRSSSSTLSLFKSFLSENGFPQCERLAFPRIRTHGPLLLGVVRLLSQQEPSSGLFPSLRAARNIVGAFVPFLRGSKMARAHVVVFQAYLRSQGWLRQMDPLFRDALCDPDFDSSPYLECNSGLVEIFGWKLDRLHLQTCWNCEKVTGHKIVRPTSGNAVTLMKTLSNTVTVAASGQPPVLPLAHCVSIVQLVQHAEPLEKFPFVRRSQVRGLLQLVHISTICPILRQAFADLRSLGTRLVFVESLISSELPNVIHNVVSKQLQAFLRGLHYDRGEVDAPERSVLSFASDSFRHVFAHETTRQKSLKVITTDLASLLSSSDLRELFSTTLGSVVCRNPPPEKQEEEDVLSRVRIKIVAELDFKAFLSKFGLTPKRSRLRRSDLSTSSEFWSFEE